MEVLVMHEKQDNTDEVMTVGTFAKKMGTTVRTLQYYDQEGILSPAPKHKGKRRLYTHKDMVKLHQIQSLKSLGFSLKDIKHKLIHLDTPAEVADVLTQQALRIQEKIKQLTETQSEIERLKEEVLKMQTVDFKKYADIIINLQMNNDYYWLIKHFDDDFLDQVSNRFDKNSSMAFIQRFQQLSDEILSLKEQAIAPTDALAQQLAKTFWDLIMEFAEGDMRMLPKLLEFGRMIDENSDWSNRQGELIQYIQPALELYFKNNGIDPFGGKSS